MTTEPFDRIDQRLTDLEVKLSYTEDLVEQLDAVVIEQARRIDLLVRELTRLRQQAEDSSGTPGARSLRDELPPHY
ncbi:SlyX family protein [Leptothrix discophora]|uniref:SlyX family protein n=1 Tax=Leptothrix discophora TaxID=89 RepID=A0ABT9G7A5_LEPDI|nr:SlyX family protein [Leptothrix discophora]MDP4302368.1 SlyX family protein [Leptothrix discophora]